MIILIKIIIDLTKKVWYVHFQQEFQLMAVKPFFQWEFNISTEL